MSAVDYRKFSNRVCNPREAGFIGIGFVVAVGILAAIILGIYFGTQCGEGQVPCQDGYTCVPKEAWCNGVNDCAAGDDEWECHAREFYVAFRTNQKDMATLQSQNETYRQKIIDKLSATGPKPENVTIFRLPRVNSTGHIVPENETQTDYPLAVHATVIYPLLGESCANATKSDGIYPVNITSWLKLGQPETNAEIQFDEPGPGVTTGVAVILTGNPACRRRKVYCSFSEPCMVYQFSSKGCPSFPCTCLKKTCSDEAAA